MKKGFWHRFRSCLNARERGTGYSGKLRNLFCLSGNVNPILQADILDSDADASLMSGDELPGKMPDRPEEKFLCFSRQRKMGRHYVYIVRTAESL